MLLPAVPKVRAALDDARHQLAAPAALGRRSPPPAEHRPRIAGHPADAEGAVHEAYLRALTSAPAQLEVPPAWLTAVLRHVAIDTLRKHQRDTGQPGAADMPDLAPSAQQLAERVQDSRRALRWLSERLSPDDAALLLLREVFGESHAAIAARTGKSDAACRQSVHRSLARLRAVPGKHKPGDRATADALHALCLRALQTHSPAPLYAILASPVTARGCPAGCDRPGRWHRKRRTRVSRSPAEAGYFNDLKRARLGRAPSSPRRFFLSASYSVKLPS
ncbi:sigma factor-like helix-turn-helix DNA-binding protein [Hydrogenophaga electricum]|uniref:sigma factor-like helix-turn-helix DNA-binding protein n=1 Tax=Hydrogenophaga electricum TaxID=1230953 RepID=UPI00351A840F